MQLIILRDKVSPTRVGLPGEFRTVTGCPHLGRSLGKGVGGERVRVVVTAPRFSSYFSSSFSISFQGLSSFTL